MDNCDLIPINDFGKPEVLSDPEVQKANIIAFEFNCPQCDGQGFIQKSSNLRSK